MTLYMETTKISAVDTVAQVQKILGMYGVVSVFTEYENGEVSALSFMISIKGEHVPFRLPSRWDAIEKILLKRKKRDAHKPQVQKQIQDQAKRVAWRQILRWVEAQLALTDTGMAEIGEVFLPYMRTGKNETLYQRFLENGLKMIEHKEGK